MIIPPQPVEPRPRLDQLIDLMRQHDPRPWGWRPVWLPCVGLVVAIGAGAIASHFVHPHGFAAALATVIALTAVLYAVLIAAIWVAGRDLARRYAGWGWAFGLQRPRAMDFAWLAAGFGIALGGRIAVAIVANAVNSKAVRQSQNLVVHTHSLAVYLVLGVIVVLIAPFVEELMFRGLMLRTMMRHWGFWPGALASSAIFALFHTYEVGTVAGALTLAGVVFTLGLANCLVTRWSGRLAAGIMNHMLFNGLAIAVLIAMNA